MVCGEGRCGCEFDGGYFQPLHLAFQPLDPGLVCSAVLPSFTKMPHDIAIRTGTMARLECAATGHPNPQIAWQKDGGTDFPAARERRMHVMPDDDVFFITDVKVDDMGVYSCTAQNSAGSISANATLTVLGSTVDSAKYIYVCVAMCVCVHVREKFSSTSWYQEARFSDCGVKLEVSVGAISILRKP